MVRQFYNLPDSLMSLNVVFGNFVSKQIEFHKEVDSIKAENNRLKGENEAKDIKLKLSRFVADLIRSNLIL